MLEKTIEILYKVTGTNDITLDTDFVKDLKLNSFDIIKLITEFEMEFKTTVPTREVWNLHTVRDLIDYMKTKGIK
jgi:Acyl carrier protein